jgi:hypothetical protein
MTQPRRRERDLTPREYARRYQETYGQPSNPFVTLFWLIFYLATFVLMLIAIQAALFNLFKVDPFDWLMTRVAGPSHVQVGPALAPTASIRVQSQPPAAVVVPQEQPAAVQEQAPVVKPTEVPAQPQEQPSELQAPVQEQAAPAATAAPTIAPTTAPKAKPTSWATADAFVVKSDFVKATPDARWTGGWKSIPTK